MADDLAGKRLLLVGTGAIGTAFLPGIVSHLLDRGCVVRVALSEGGARMVSATALSAVSANPVIGPGWSVDQSGGAEHVRHARWPTHVAVWPASLSFCAKLAWGLMDDLAAAVVLSSAAPVLIAPSVPEDAARRATTKLVIRQLRNNGFTVFDPVVGPSVGGRGSGDGCSVPFEAVIGHIREPGDRHPETIHGGPS